MTTTETPVIDEARAEEFVGKALGDLAGTMTVLLAGIGDQLGLFAALKDAGPLTADAVAERVGTDARYTREWLAAMAAAGYLDYDADTERFILPAEHAPVVAQETGPVFFGGAWEEIAGALPHLGAITDAFRHGGGVASSEYGHGFWHGIERFTAGWFENHLLPTWIPAMPEVEQRLQRGAAVADVGCGAGRALITLAQAFPDSTYVGYDILEANVSRARQQATEAGVADRVRFEQLDATDGLPGTFDVIFTFDVIHDAVDPAALLAAIRGALADGGRYVCLDINASHRIEENVGPLGTVFYGFSVLYCMTSSLAHGGAGLGTCGFNEHVAHEMCNAVGFSLFRRVPLDNPFNNLYEAVK